MSKEKARFSIMVSDETLNMIDDFRYGNRFATRNKAVNELFRIAFEAIHQKTNKCTDTTISE